MQPLLCKRNEKVSRLVGFKQFLAFRQTEERRFQDIAGPRPLIEVSVQPGEVEGDAQLDELLAATRCQANTGSRRRCTGSAGKSYGDAARKTLRRRGGVLLALATARRQKTRVFELRVALDLAGLYRDLDQRARARDVLEPALLGLPEGQKLLEADKARDLLISLA